MGEGPDRARIENLIATLSLRDNVQWCGHIPHPALTESLGAGWVQVLASRSPETGANVIPEAMMRSTAVVATRFDGAPEGLRDTVTGFLVPPFDAEALADRLVALLGDCALAERIGRACRGDRAQSVTDLAFVNGRVYVAGLSNEEFTSKLWSVGYPFASADNGASIEIYHGNHGALETRLPVMASVPHTIGGELNILAGYTCTPLVKIPVQALKAGTKVVGTTIAEFGAGNQPLDLMVYRKDEKDFLLMSNSRHGVIKIGTDGFATASPITARVGGTAGVGFGTIATMTNVEQMDLLNAGRTMVISRGASGRNLNVVVLP